MALDSSVFVEKSTTNTVDDETPSFSTCVMHKNSRIVAREDFGLDRNFFMLHKLLIMFRDNKENYRKIPDGKMPFEKDHSKAI